MKKNIVGLSLLTLTCLYGFLSAIIILITILSTGEALIGIIISLIAIVIQFLIAPWLTDLSMRWFYKAKMEEALPEYLEKFISDTCAKYNIKHPKIGIIHDGAPNAFTYGRAKNDARIIITTGLYDLLTEDEVIAVVGHEMGHIIHQDMLFMTAAQAVPLILYAIYETFSNSSKSNDDDNKLAIVGLIAYIIYVISEYIILWLSRTREYYADSFSIEETKNPNGLAEALVKIGFGLSTTNSKVSKGNALGIFDSKTSKSMVISCSDNNGINKEKIKQAMKWEMWNPWAKWFQLNSTHPLISKRLLCISKRSEEFNQNPYITFDLKPKESYVDDFLFDVLLTILPFITMIIGIIVCIVIPNKFTIGIFVLLFLLFEYILFNRKYKGKDFKENTVSGLLSEVKVSGITSIPCVLKGTIIGKGDPGCIFSEDYVIKDETGIIFLDYNQPLKILNKAFAIFKSADNINKEVIVRGWYRRSPVPYVEILDYEINGKVKKIYTAGIRKKLIIIMSLITIILMAIL